MCSVTPSSSSTPLPRKIPIRNSFSLSTLRPPPLPSPFRLICSKQLLLLLCNVRLSTSWPIVNCRSESSSSDAAANDASPPPPYQLHSFYLLLTVTGALLQDTRANWICNARRNKRVCTARPPSIVRRAALNVCVCPFKKKRETKNTFISFIDWLRYVAYRTCDPPNPRDTQRTTTAPLPPPPPARHLITITRTHTPVLLLLLLLLMKRAVKKRKENNTHKIWWQTSSSTSLSSSYYYFGVFLCISKSSVVV